MYDFVLLAHSWLRWLVLLAGARGDRAGRRAA